MEQIAVDDLVGYEVDGEKRRGTVRAIVQGREDERVGQHFVALIDRPGGPDVKMLCRLTKLRVRRYQYHERLRRMVEVK